MSANRQRISAVSFTRSHTLSDGNNTSNVPSEDDADDDDFQINLAPHIQSYLARASQGTGCLGRCLPIPFERAAQRSWCNPHFDSEILEGQYRTSAFPQLRLRFRYALLYVLLVSLSWFVYFLSSGVDAEPSARWWWVCTVLATLAALLVALLAFTHTDLFREHFLAASACMALLLYALSLALVLVAPATRIWPPPAPSMSPVGHFSICVEVLLLVYTVIPLPLYACALSGLLYSAAFEAATAFVHGAGAGPVLVRCAAHLCAHLVGLHILIMTNVRMRGTFMKVGQSLLVRRQLELEKQLKEKMIHSVMPPKLADWLMHDDANFAKSSEPRASNPESTYLRSLFRPFNMHRMENVSILFADIVGFTRMSSNKSAEELVAILNDLFERFDHLCALHECEKISTLGDCYYCVSGCPEPRADHAKCCVDMGLGMIQAIRQFDAERNEGVNMRVGVHTGTVLCGIVGTCRFKFDVWSNDVTLANRMEATGRPGAVHASERTCAFLPDQYEMEEGEPVFGFKTYFILDRKTDRHMSFNGSLRAPGPHHQRYESLQLVVSPPSSSPVGRPRVLSCNDGQLKAHHSPNQLLSPNMFKVKANSLPSILDSDCEDTEQDEHSHVEDSSVKSPTSAASSDKHSGSRGARRWRMPKFLRKLSADIGDLERGAKVDATEAPPANGYQQVPAIVETTCRSASAENDATLRSGSSWSSFARLDERDKPHTDDGIVDVKSYISQSRSDVGQFDYSPAELSHFMRAGSYKSQRSPRESLLLDRGAASNRAHGGRGPLRDLSPAPRARSATLAAKIDMDCLELPGSALDHHLSECVSVNSRKDSGIRSNSRRSSIQQQIYAMNQSTLPREELLQARVSGYYTSSQSTLNSCSPQYGSQLPAAPFCEQIGSRFQKLRKQSDLQLIRCVQDNSKSRHSYFMKPPLSNLSLFFRSADMEREYRENVHTISDKPGEMLPTLATSRYNTYFDILVSAMVFCAVAASLFALYAPTVLSLAVFTAALAIQAVAVVLCIRQIIHFSKHIYNFLSEWYRWHTLGAFIVSLPLAAVLSNFSCANAITSPHLSHTLYCYLLFVGLIHFCNFTQFNCWMKNSLVTVFALIFLCLVTVYSRECFQDADVVVKPSAISIVREELLAPLIDIRPNSLLEDPSVPDDLNAPHINENQTVSHSVYFFNISLPANSTNPIFEAKKGARGAGTEARITARHLYEKEIFIDVFLLLVLVWFLNREFEIGYRLSFHANLVANRDKAHVQSMKNQADWLLHNIIPKHVADQLKQSAKYSENHKDVGIIFASIVNFNEMYDESYLGGKEYLRVLNELIADFDELLRLPEFRSVEKIKTIGSTFMAASGLNPEVRRDSRDPHAHLYALMDFAIAMQRVVDNFNRDLIEFNLILRVGYNFGDVTAGVIGTSKLYYDIWGDAVNIASRMDSTGVNGRIQVGGACLDVLEKRYELEPRGSVYVKGKDHMNVYLLLRKKDDAAADA